MKDLRLAVTSLVVILSMIGYVIMVLCGHNPEALELLKLVGLPALTFIIGLGSELKT